MYHVRGSFPKLTNVIVVKLNVEVTEHEIHNVLFDMYLMKAPDIDGLQAGFFQNQWGVMGDFVCVMIKRIFQCEQLHVDINKTLIILIPIVVKPKSIKEI